MDLPEWAKSKADDLLRISKLFINREFVLLPRIGRIIKDLEYKQDQKLYIHFANGQIEITDIETFKSLYL